MKGLFDRTRYNFIKDFWNILRFHKLNLSILSVVKVVLLVTGVASPYLFKILIDQVMVQKDTSFLFWICLGFVGIYLVEVIVAYVELFFNSRYSLQFSFKLRVALWKKIMKLNGELKKKFSSGDLKNRLEEDVDLCETFVTNQIINYGYFWVLSVINGIVLLVISWKLAIFGFLMVPVSFWVVRWLGSGVMRSAEDFRNEWGTYEEWLQNSLGKWKEIKAQGAEKRQSIDFVIKWKSLSKLFFKRQMYWYGNRSFIAFKDFFITRMNLYFIGGLLIFNGDLTVGSLIVFMRYYEQFFSGINNINELDINLKKDTPSIARVIELLKLNIGNKGTYVAKHFKGEVRFANVSYFYDDSRMEGIGGIDLTISPGEKVAIVGKSGSGKSTLVNLLSGVIQPQQGIIMIDDIPLEHFSTKFLNTKMSFVMQDNYFFNFSIKENLLLATSKVAMEDIELTCINTNIHQNIKEMPLGYDTVLGEKGGRISGGQKQRIAIARSILRSPRILVLDEATSQLDGESEMIVNNTLAELSKQTVIMIAHRLSSIVNCTRVIVLDRGRIVGDGTHAELLQNNTTYQLLFSNQDVVAST